MVLCAFMFRIINITHLMFLMSVFLNTVMSVGDRQNSANGLQCMTSVVNIGPNTVTSVACLQSINTKLQKTGHFHIND